MMTLSSCDAPVSRSWFCGFTAGVCALVVSALLGCGGGSSGSVDNPAPEPVSPPLSLGLSSTLTEATLFRVAQVATSGGVAATSTPRAGDTLTVPPANATPLVLAADAQGRLILATLATENELSASNTAIALLWMWIKPVAGSALDDKTFASKARIAAGFDLLVTQIEAALAAGMSPIDSLPVLTTLGDVTEAMGDFAKPQGARMRPLAEIAQPRLAATAQLLTFGGKRYVDLMSGNIFVNDTANINVFNGTAIYWSAYAQSYDGKRVAEPELLSPVTVNDAFLLYTSGVPPASGYTNVLGHPSVSYDLVLLQDGAARRANAVMQLRSALEAILGTTALAFGEVSCLNSFIGTVAPAELDALAAIGGIEAFEAYMSSFEIALANISLKNLTVSASCGGGQTLLQSLTKHVPLIQIALNVYKDSFVKVDKASKAGKAIGTWIGLSYELVYADKAELKLGVCVAGGRVATCATRYELKDNQPWLEGARAVLPLAAFAGDKETLVPSTLAISSQNVLPLTAGPKTRVQVLSADLTTTLRIRDEPTGHDSSTVSLIVEPGKIQYVSLLGSATSGPFNVGQSRGLAVVSSSDASQFYGDVDFDWRVAPGSEGIVELSVGGQRLAAVKAMKPGKAVIHATNSVTRRRLEFSVGVDGTTDYWLGSFIPVDCQSPPNGMNWFWERPCYNVGIVSDQSQTGTQFWFPELGGNLVIQSQFNGGTVRRIMDVHWDSSEPLLTLSIPTSALVPSDTATGRPFQRFSGTRVFKLSIAERTDTAISGTFVMTSSSGASPPSGPVYPGNVVIPIQTTTRGTWSAGKVSGASVPILLMNGFDLCWANNTASNYPNLDVIAALPPNEANGRVYSSLEFGDQTGTCSYGKVNF